MPPLSFGGHSLRVLTSFNNRNTSEKTMPIEIDGHIISDAEIRFEIEQLIRDHRIAPGVLANDRNKLRLQDLAKNNVIDTHLLFLEARKQKLSLSQEEEPDASMGEEDRALLHKHRLVAKFMDRIRDEIREPKDRHVKGYYKDHPEAFVLEDKIRVQQIVKTIQRKGDSARVREETEKIRATILKGKTFDYIARQKSDMPNSIDMGWVKRGETQKELEDILFALNEGDISEPVPTQHGWTLYRIAEKQLPRTLSLEEAEASIREAIKEEAFSERILEITKARRKKATIRETA